MDEIICGDSLTVLRTLPDESVDCVITSPPYWGLRDYGIEGQIGLEPTIEEFLTRMLAVTAECKRVLKNTGVMFWNHGDSYGNATSGAEGDQKNPGRQSSAVPKKKKQSGRTTRPNLASAYEIERPAMGMEKCLMMQPYRLAMRMVDEQGWTLRNIIIWHKPNAMPSSVKDRFGVDYEPVFFFSKSKKYYFEQQLEKAVSDEDTITAALPQGFNMQVRDVARGKVASAQYKASEEEIKNADRLGRRKMQDPTMGGSGTGLYGHSGNYRLDGSYIGTPGMRGKRTVWTISTKAFAEAHFATFPEELIEPMILAGTPPGGVVLDPFMGAGTTAVVAKKLGRHYLGIELNPAYIELAEERIAGVQLPLLTV